MMRELLILPAASVYGDGNRHPGALAAQGLRECSICGRSNVGEPAAIAHAFRLVAATPPRVLTSALPGKHCMSAALSARFDHTGCTATRRPKTQPFLRFRRAS